MPVNAPPFIVLTFHHFLVLVLDEWLGERIQFPVPTGRLFQQRYGATNGQHMLVVLHQQVHRVLRYRKHCCISICNIYLSKVSSIRFLFHSSTCFIVGAVLRRLGGERPIFKICKKIIRDLSNEIIRLYYLIG